MADQEQATPPTSTTTNTPSTEQQQYRSPSASRLKKSINGLVHRVKEVMSPPSPGEMSYSTSRGRSPDRKDATASTGRGGAGNMVSSKSRDRAKISECHDLQEGDRILKKYPIMPRSIGRGGAGNIRSLSRDLKKRQSEERHLKELEEEEKEIEASYIDRHKYEPAHHVGRGGAGNVSQARALASIYDSLNFNNETERP